MTLLRNVTLVRPNAVISNGWLLTTGERITAFGSSADEVPGNEFANSTSETFDLGGAYIVPGFVDMHVHGGGGASFTTGDPQEALRAIDFHRAHGTTTNIASGVTAAIPDLEKQVSELAGLVEDGTLAGLHLEGPFLSTARCGAHDPALLRAPELPLLEQLVAAGRGTIRMVTLAPELPGGLDAVKWLADQGIIAAVGHTDADAPDARSALNRGASVATHLFNAMRGLQHRDPTAANALLSDNEAILELVNDGFHVDPTLISLVFKMVGAGRVALITDAVSAAGMPDGAYQLGPLDIQVAGGIARLDDGETIAGSTMTMDVAFRRAVQVIGLPIEQASLAASLTPARAIGVDDRVGSIEVGKIADLVVLDSELCVAAVMSRGSWFGDPTLPKPVNASLSRTQQPDS
ncbi:MAG: N-acetylglucosamine-6-phosphate deacetylase [Acidothermaceae bacterium]